MLCRNKEGVAANKDEIEKLKKICKELEKWNLEEQEKIDNISLDHNNLAMNCSLNQRQNNDTFEEQQEQIDELKKKLEELGNMAPPEPINIPTGGDIDMNALNSIFARKTPPENTIKRIEELEKRLAD